MEAGGRETEAGTEVQRQHSQILVLTEEEGTAPAKLEPLPLARGKLWGCHSQLMGTGVKPDVTSGVTSVPGAPE